MSDMEVEAQKLRKSELAVRDMCDDLDPSIITSQSAPSMNKLLEDICSARNLYRNDVRDFLDKFAANLSAPEVNQWKADLKSVVDRVNSHKMAVIGKVNELLPPVQPMSEYEKAAVEIQRKQLELQQKQVDIQLLADDYKKKEAHAVAQPLRKLIMEKCTALDDELERVNLEQLKSGDDQTVTRIMLKFAGWQTSLDSITNTHSNLLEKTALYPLAAEIMAEVNSVFEATKVSFANVKSTVEEEDERRQLYSLDTSSRSEQVKWPTFSGEAGDDFVKFKTDFLDACKQNRTSLKNQCTKLKESLKGYARTLIPTSVTDIEKAWGILKRACGDSMKLVNHRIENLMNVGPWPQDGSRDCFTKQVKWIIKVQGLIQEIIDLANSNEELAAVVYNRHQLSQILKLFPIFMIDKLAELPGYQEEKYTQIIDKLDKWKAVSLNRESILGSSSSQKQANSKPDKPPNNPAGHVTFSKPKRFDSCRICKVLEAQGSTLSLYEGHMSDFATGCPLFANLGTDQRMVIAREAKFCVNCMGKDTKFSMSHLRDCPMKKKKSTYSCKKEGCLVHMWLCKKHQTVNKDSMEKFCNQLRTKAGIQLVFLSRQLDPRPELARPADIVGSHVPDSAQTTLPCATSPMSYCVKNDTGIKRAARKLHRFNRKSDPNAVTVNPPTGVPLFLFQPVEGTNGPVNTFYDLGCSDAIFRDGIPGVELKGTLLNRGPFQMGGVGDIMTEAIDEWLVQLNRVDGKKQLVKGVTLKKITCDFPAIDTTEAVKELLNSDKSNQFLQSCKVPPIAGGTVDLLLGIKYSLIQPIPVQSLDNGLTIYRSRLTSHNRTENALIGGPHTSFQFLADRVGNIGALLTHFAQNLSSLRSLSAPKIPTNPLTIEEEAFALAHNAWEVRNLVDSSAKRGESHCMSCYLNFSTDDENGDTLREIRRLRLEQECGIDMDYRCVRCRDCAACKNSEKVEAISLKEEAEMELIDQSVTLDLEKKQILCTLPLRGDEKQFLTSNRARALKVLEQQVKQYGNQPETKDLILKAFEKLFVNGHASFIEDIDPDNLKEFINKPISYFIPWRIAFSDSATTPARPVLDASSRTSRRPDGTGGKSLNDLVCQGKVETLNLLNLVLNFRVGLFAVTGDIRMFYNACKLRPSQWNLQRFLFQPDMDPSAPVREGVIQTLIYGVSSVSAQSECAMKKLGDLVQHDKPDVKKLIDKRRYVDDIGDSKRKKEDCIALANNTDEVFSLVSLECKCWTFSGDDPDPKVSKDGASISVAGSPWFPKLDVFVVKVPALHFGKRRRGKLDANTQFFSGSTLEEMNSFCPNPLNRKQVTSKFASIWDMTGKLAPVLAEAKCLLSETVSATKDWVSPMPAELRTKWLVQFLLWEKLRGLKFERAVMPPDAVDGKMRLIQKVDATERILSQACWGGFRRKSGIWSCQLILARNLLAPKNSTIPKLELQALTNGSNMCWIIRKMLEDWVADYFICGDSAIALCWTTSEKKTLSLYHRNRVIQIRRGTELDKLYHIRTEENLADMGTRPEKIRVSDIGPDSDWENGKTWMQGDLDAAVSQGILKPVGELRISPDNDGDYQEGLVYGGDPLKLSCNAVNQSRMDKLLVRLNYSNYLLNPTRYDFRKLVRILAIVISFVRKCRGKVPESLQISETARSKLSAFVASHNTSVKSDPIRSLSQLLPNSKFTTGRICVIDQDLQLALVYLYRKSTKEVLNFNPKAKVEKVGVMKEGILFSKARIIEGMEFENAGDLGISDIGKLGLKALTPVIDRYSPLAYCIARHVHWNLARHKGVETCNRMSLEHVTILQGANLYKELREECIRCRIKYKKYIDMPMGLLSENQLKVCPPFWSAQMDLFGPIQVYVPGFEKSTRNRTLKTECHVLIFACPVSRLLNLQVIEKKDASGIVDGVTRLACEVGIPKLLLMDQDSAFLKAMTEVEYTIQDAELKLNRESGINFITCPVSGHNQHGQVERRIRSVQESLDEAGLRGRKLHATGLQTLLKLVENQLNNLPLGYSFGRDQDNTPLLKMISPNMLRVGRSNSRALHGPMRLPRGGELLDKVKETYETWFTIWASSYIPKIMFQPKWFNEETDIGEGDIVMFKKKDKVLEEAWTLGKIDQLISGRDGRSRRAIVQYQNLDETFKRTSDRSIRSLVKIWSLNDQCFDDDITALEEMLRSTEKGSAALGQVPGRSEDDVVNTVKLDAVGGMMTDCGVCCSLGHCQLVLDGVEHGFFCGHDVSSCSGGEASCDGSGSPGSSSGYCGDVFNGVPLDRELGSGSLVGIEFPAMVLVPRDDGVEEEDMDDDMPTCLNGLSWEALLSCLELNLD